MSKLKYLIINGQIKDNAYRNDWTNSYMKTILIIINFILYYPLLCLKKASGVILLQEIGLGNVPKWYDFLSALVGIILYCVIYGLMSKGIK